MTSSARATLKASLFERWVALCNWLGRFPISILLLGCRLAVGLYWFKGVLLRLQSPEFGLKLFQEEYKVPLLDPKFGHALGQLQ